MLNYIIFNHYTEMYFQHILYKLLLYNWTTFICLKLGNKSKNTDNYFLQRILFRIFHKTAQKVKEKIVWTLDLIELIDNIPETYLKHLEGTDKLYEIWVQSGSNIF